MRIAIALLLVVASVVAGCALRQPGGILKTLGRGPAFSVGIVDRAPGHASVPRAATPMRSSADARR